jgi:hypothetical protein
VSDRAVLEWLLVIVSFVLGFLCSLLVDAWKDREGR